MDKERSTDWVVDQSYAARPHMKLSRLLIAVAVILLNLQTMACAAEDSAKNSHQGQSLIVKNWKGEYIGTSRHVVMDPSAGNIVFVILSLETGQSKQIKEIAVPWVLFSVDKENGALVLSINKKQLESAPEYSASNLEDPEFVGRIYHFFGLAPPWTEETPEAKRMNL